MYEDWDPNTPAQCAMLCDLGPECAGFSYKMPQCWLAKSKTTTQWATVPSKDVTRVEPWITYWKSDQGQRSVAGDLHQSTNACDAWYSSGEPCLQHAIAATTDNLVDDTFASFNSANWDLLLPLDATDNWQGSAPGAFNTALANVAGDALVLETQHVPDNSGLFTFPETDTDCGCSYDTYTSSMVAGKNEVGYGFYESTFKSTATDFVNAFWMQGDTAEINVLKVEGGVATTSLYCFSDQDNQWSETETISSNFAVDQDHTVTLSWNEEKVTVLIDGLIVMQKDTPSCMKGVTMKPIFSVEVGETLPSTDGVASGASFGAMTVKYFRKWSTVTNSVATDATVNDGGVICKAADKSVHNFGGGMYQGPVPKGVGDGKWIAHCGVKLDGFRKTRLFNRLTITECGEECEKLPGCNAFWWSKAEFGRCRLYADVVAQFKTDSMIPQEFPDDPVSKRVGNIYMTKPVVRLNGVDVIAPRIPISCPDSTYALNNGFTKKCFASPQALGSRAAIDLDQDGVIDYGCPYDRTEFFNAKGNRVAKACTASHCTRGVCPGGTDAASGAKLPPPFARQSDRQKSNGGWDATKNYSLLDSGPGELTVDLCVEICAKSCSCHSAGWELNKKECWLISKSGFQTHKATPQAGPNKQPQLNTKWVTYAKDAATAQKLDTMCNIAELVAKGSLVVSGNYYTKNNRTGTGLW
jgi:hypothetical protein